MNLHEMLLAPKMSGKNNGNADLSDYYTKSQTDGFLSGKVDKVTGKGLSTNDFTNEYKQKINDAAAQSTTYTKTETDQRITTKVAEIVSNAPEDFDTLKEISDWIEKHENSAAAMNTAIATNATAITTKVDKIEGMGLSENSFTNAEKAKLAELESYDDMEIKANIANVAEQSALNRSTLGYQSKNLLKNTAVSGTSYGINYTVNADGSVTSDAGTPTGVSFVMINTFTFKADVNYILSGAPNDESSETRISLMTSSSTGETKYRDTGNGVAIKFDTDTTYYIRIRFGSNGETITAKTFYPMLRYAEITDNTYEPYKPSIEERLTALENAILGGISND